MEKFIVFLWEREYAQTPSLIKLFSKKFPFEMKNSRGGQIKGPIPKTETSDTYRYVNSPIERHYLD